MLEISKILTISTAHISLIGAEYLDYEVETGTTELIVYEKGEYGWLILARYCDEDGYDSDVPKCIRDCIDLAKKHDCEWLCLDRDGEVVSELPNYDWS